MVDYHWCARQGKKIPGTEEDLADKDKVEAKTRIMESMEQRMEQRFTALCHASRSGDADAVGTLARQGANLNQADYDGRTAFRELQRGERQRLGRADQAAISLCM